jgi:hypothetical protein
MAIAAGHWSAHLLREKQAASLHSRTRMQGLKDRSARIKQITTITCLHPRRARRRVLLLSTPKPCLANTYHADRLRAAGSLAYAARTILECPMARSPQPHASSLHGCMQLFGILAKLTKIAWLTCHSGTRMDLPRSHSLRLTSRESRVGGAGAATADRPAGVPLRNRLVGRRTPRTAP